MNSLTGLCPGRVTQLLNLRAVLRVQEDDVFGDGATADECVASTRAALVAAVGYMLEVGKSPPPPAQQGLRTQQVNVRLTPEEKALLESRARSRGFSGLSDFVRAIVMETVK